jgi:ABC-type antimicrobial peptide transport system permease subunit
MAEAAILGLVGGLGGTMLALAAALTIDMLAARVLPPFPFKPDSFFFLPGWLLSGGVALGVLSAVAGAFLPARRASAIDPARVLAGQVG